jgi:hypothetical protein
MADDSYDASDETAENNAKRDEARKQREDHETLKRLLSHKNGRAWFYRVLEKCHIYGTPFMPGEAETTFFRLGQEDVGKRMMLEAVYACPDLYMTMLAEARKEEERVAGLRADEEKKRKGDEDIALRTQGFELPPPPGWEGRQ